MTNFEKWDKEFRTQNLFAFNNNANALLWLKVRAISRSKQIGRFITQAEISLQSTKTADQNKELFELLEQDINRFMPILDDFLKERNNDWYVAMNVDEEKLKNDLYKITHYAWGGDQNNSLDKHLVSRYVKVISSFDELVTKQGEISDNAWNYVQTSWYNNWTSFLIESLFKRHPKVISAVGEIKSVDFFIDNKPIDLKVTYFPNQYMDEMLKRKLGKKELSWLKEKAKSLKISYDSTLSDTQQVNMIKEKISVAGANNIINELTQKKKEVISEAQNNPTDIIKWLYENQGEMRFGAENRLFIILVDATDISQSWKMKRAFELIAPQVNSYLDMFNAHSLKNINFEFKKTQYQTLADAIFIVKR